MKYNEKGCNNNCSKCGPPSHKIKLESGKDWCKLKCIYLTGIKVNFKKEKIIQDYY